MHSRNEESQRPKKIKNAEDIKTPLLPFITFSYIPAFRRKIQIDNSKPLLQKRRDQYFHDLDFVRIISPNFQYLLIGK
jgi:hypothetical protein